MLVLSRRKDESVVLGGKIKIVVVDIHGDKVRLGIEAPSDVEVLRSELVGKKRQNDKPESVDSSERVGSLSSDDVKQACKILSPDESSVERVVSKIEEKAPVQENRCVSLEISPELNRSQRRVRKTVATSTPKKKDLSEGNVDKRREK